MHHLLRKARTLFAVVISILLLASSASGQAQFERRNRSSDSPVRNAEIRIDDRQDRVAVLLVLRGESAAAAYARVIARGKAEGGPRTMVTADADRAARSARATARVAQDGVMSALQTSGIGYREIYRVQRAVNGVAVEVDRGSLSALAGLAGVVRVIPIETEYPHAFGHSNAGPLMKVPDVWQMNAGAGKADGTGIRIGIIDTGVDYLHAAFGGSGLLTDYQTNVRTAAPDAFFPNAKVVGGYDFAGDTYNGTTATIVADPDPMDCNGHGTHVAGIAAGVGVKNDGTPFTGPYGTAIDYSALRLHPGVAPKASIYALRVFGCGGGTNLTIQAIDWAMDPNNDDNLSDRLDVINMSLGSNFGTISSSTAVAANAASLIGMSVVASAGNSGDTFFVSGAPGSGTGVITVANSVDDGFVFNNFRVNGPGNVAGIYANTIASYFGGPPPVGGLTAPVVIALDAADAAGPSTTDACSSITNPEAVNGKIALVDRGTCGFAIKVKNAQLAGALGVIVASNTAAAIGNMGGSDPTITIPAIYITQALGNTLRAEVANGLNVTFFNPIDTLAGSSSRGPRGGSVGVLKPDVTAPGTNIVAPQTGTTCTNVAPSTGCIAYHSSGYIAGSTQLTLSGTSMAAPQIAGLAALVRQLHPDWTPEEVKASIVNGASGTITTAIGGATQYGVGRVGSGRADAAATAQLSTLAFNGEESGSVGVWFGEDFISNGTRTRKVFVQNKSNSPVTYDLSLAVTNDAPGMSFSLPGGSVLSVPANSTASIDVQFNATPASMDRYREASVTGAQVPGGTTVVATQGPQPRHFLTEESALLKFAVAGAEKMRLPLLATSRPASSMSGPTSIVTAGTAGSVSLPLSGTDVCTGTRSGATCAGSFAVDSATRSGDVKSLVSPFELQVVSPRSPNSAPANADIRYAGVAFSGGSDPNTTTDDALLFGVSMYGEWMSPSETTVNVHIDNNNDGTWDRIIFNANTGTLQGLFIGASAAGVTDVQYTSVFTPPSSVSYGGFARFTNVADPSQLDTALTRSDTVVLAASTTTLGITGAFRYKITTCPGVSPLCSVPYDQAAGPYSWNAGAQGLNFAGVIMADEMNGGSLNVAYDTTNIAANGSLGALLLHHHNQSGRRAQVIPMAGSPSTDLGISMSLSPANATIGQTATATVTVVNNGTPATGVKAWVLLPDGVTFVSDSAGTGYDEWTGTSGSEIWTIGDLAAGASATMQVIVTIDDSEPKSFVAKISEGTPLDTNPANDSSTISYSPLRSADLDLDVTATAGPVHVGDPIDFQLKVTNLGVDAAYSVDIDDVFAAAPALTATAATASIGSYNAASHQWNLSGLAPGASATLDLDFTAPNMAGALTGVGTASTTTADVALANNSAQATLTVLSPATITGTITREGFPYPGRILTYRIRLTNSSEYDQQNNPGHEMTFTIPGTLSFDEWGSAVLSGAKTPATNALVPAVDAVGTFTTSGQNLYWDGVVPGESTVEIWIETLVNPMTAPGTSVSLDGDFTFDADGNGTNEQSGATAASAVTIVSPALIAGPVKVIDTVEPTRLGFVIYSITFTNSGPAPQFDNPGDELVDVLPTGLVPTSATATTGSAAITGNTVTWNGYLAAGESVTVTIRASIAGDAPYGTINNQATIHYDADGNGTNEASVLTGPTAAAAAVTAFAIVPPIPALDPRALLLLAAALSFTAWFALRR